MQATCLVHGPRVIPPAKWHVPARGIRTYGFFYQITSFSPFSLSFLPLSQGHRGQIRGFDADLVSPLNGHRCPVCTHRDSTHCVDKPEGGNFLPLSLSTLLAPGGWGSSNEPWTLMLPDRSKMFFLHYLGT